MKRKTLCSAPSEGEMSDFNEQFLAQYPDLRLIFTCAGCGRHGTHYAYKSASIMVLLLDDQGVQLTDRQGQPRTVEKAVRVCQFCGGLTQTQTTR